MKMMPTSVSLRATAAAGALPDLVYWLTLSFSFFR
jgi:hypothetical protein